MVVGESAVQKFRANGGRVDGAEALLVTTAAGGTDRPRQSLLAYRVNGGRYLVSDDGPGRSARYADLLLAPAATVEVGADGGTRTYAVRAVEVDGPAATMALQPLKINATTARGLAAALLAHHDDLRAMRDKARQQPDAGRQLREHCLAFCFGLQLHHTRENGGFTAFEEAYPRLRPAIARLRAEHRIVETALAALEEAVESGHEQRIRAALEEAAAGLEEHFAYEEEQLLAAVGQT
jgi:hypothetical protein